MRRFVLLWLAVFVTSAAAQTTAPSQAAKTSAPPAKKAATSSTKTSTSSPAVITIQGLCTTKTAGAACKTVITKADFELIIRVLQPNLPAQRRKQLALSYVEALTFATNAQKTGLDKDPEFQKELQEQVKLVRLRMLASAYRKHLQEQSSKISETDLEKYYNENKEAYQEVTLKRLFIPKPITSTTEKKPPLDEAAAKELAEKLRQRAASGEDFNTLQQEAFAAAYPDQPKNSAPSPDMGPRRGGSLPPQQEAKIFEVKPGGITPVLEEPSGYFVYKVEAIRTLPFSEVKNQILRQRQEQNFKDSVEKTMAAVKPVYDEQYFNPPQPKPGAENNKMGPQGMNSQPPATPGVPSATPPGPDGPPARTPASSGAPTPAPSATPTPAPSPTAAPK